MKKKLITLLSLSTLVLAACDTETEKTTASQTETTQTESSTQAPETTRRVPESTEEDEGQPYYFEPNDTFADDELVTATLETVEYQENSETGETRVVFTFHVTNNTEQTFSVQSREVSIDDLMLDMSQYSMYMDISPGKSGKVNLIVRSRYENTPVMEDNLEMTMVINNTEDYSRLGEYPVKYELPN